jgi:hypothetical protein
VLPAAGCLGSRAVQGPELQGRAVFELAVFELAVFELESVVPFFRVPLVNLYAYSTTRVTCKNGLR